MIHHRPFAAAAALGLAAMAVLPTTRPAVAQMRTCANPDALGVSRVVEIDASKGQVFGGITQAPTQDILKLKEVVLTFDDGPFEGLSRRILDTLDQHCTKATFFVVGQMAVARPQIVREEIARGHTVGTHTWSHPMPMKALTIPAQIEEIDKGIAAASRVAGRGLAPFFRFPGLGDSPETLAHLKGRGIATFTVDIVSNDSFIADPAKLAERTMNILASKGKGILLFHDIKPATAAALPIILDDLQRGGYRVVHLVAKGQGGSRRSPVTAAIAAPVDAASAALPALQAQRSAERLPWGMSHPGPMPTILPHPKPATRPSVTTTPAAAASAAGTSVQPGPQPPAQARTPPNIPQRAWPDSIFGTGDKS